MSLQDLQNVAMPKTPAYIGVYFLFGKDEANIDTVYIGKAEKILTRLKQHINETEDRNDCIIVISKDNLLNKAHAKYLENKFYELAKNAGRAVIVNSTVPICSSVSEYDEVMLQEFICNAKLLVNTWGYKTFDSLEDSSLKQQNNQVYFYIKTVRGADAKGLVVADGFAVLKGSFIAAFTTPSLSSSYLRLRSSLMENGIIDSNFQFVKDYIFTNPSAAAAIVTGKSTNGRTKWKTEDNKSLKFLEEGGLS